MKIFAGKNIFWVLRDVLLYENIYLHLLFRSRNSTLSTTFPMSDSGMKERRKFVQFFMKFVNKWFCDTFISLVVVKRGVQDSTQYFKNFVHIHPIHFNCQQILLFKVIPHNSTLRTEWCFDNTAPASRMALVFPDPGSLTGGDQSDLCRGGRRLTAWPPRKSTLRRGCPRRTSLSRLARHEIGRATRNDAERRGSGPELEELCAHPS